MVSLGEWHQNGAVLGSPCLIEPMSKYRHNEDQSIELGAPRQCYGLLGHGLTGIKPPKPTMSPEITLMRRTFQ